MTTLEKVRRLEQYLTTGNSIADPVVAITIDKLIQREYKQLLELRGRLVTQITEFENKYAQSSAQFQLRYESGELGDEMDFIEWAATIQMIANLDQRLALLKPEPVP